MHKRLASVKKFLKKHRQVFVRAGMVALAFPFLSVTAFILFAYQTRIFVYDSGQPIPAVATTSDSSAPFPIGVMPREKKIVENPDVDTFFEEHIVVLHPAERSHTTWLGKAVARLAQMTWYQNLANAGTRILVIESGERREQVGNNFAKILGWTKEQKEKFLSLVAGSTPEMDEGKFFPATYVVSRGASPEEAALLVEHRFGEEVFSRYTNEIEALVPLEDALIIASLLEREASDFEDMRHISGVIWNRLFTDMNLQIDATLQYAKGTVSETSWWPPVRPKDKYIESPYNTYQNGGLPPAPIANPSVDAVLAALNPYETECMYYFHDADGGFHCSPTYTGHVELLKQYYGRGK